MSWKDRLKEGLSGGETPAPARSAKPELRAVPPPAEHGDAVLADLVAQVVALSEGELGPESIDPDGHMLDQGYINSLSAVTFLAHIEDRYRVAIEDLDLVGPLRTLRAVAEHVKARQ
jgi:acyl carrier protein